MSATAKQFVRHYLEMVVAMFVGMGVLAVPADWVTDRLGATSDAFMFLEMATTMTVGMVGWMLYRGHGWRANADMTAAMFVPAFAVVGLLSAGVLTDLGMLMVIEHVAMLAAMAGAMFLRPAEYACHTHHDAAMPERVTA